MDPNELNPFPPPMELLMRSSEPSRRPARWRGWAAAQAGDAVSARCGRGHGKEAAMNSLRWLRILAMAGLLLAPAPAPS